jgi:glycogen synthase
MKGEAFQPDRRPPRLLFCSYHCYWDPSSGAALCTRELLELLAQRGWSCRVFCGPRLDFEHDSCVSEFLAAQQIAFETRQTTARETPVSVFHFRHGGVPVQLFDSPAAGPSREVKKEVGVCFLALYEQLLERFQPDLVLTYGGDWVAQQIIAQAKRRNIPVVFALHNFGYKGAELFRPVDAVLVPSCFAQAHYRRTLGLTCTAIPGPWDWWRVRCPEIRPTYLTFVNPQPEKGVFVFARIAAELANTPDPRHFYQISKIVLMPSLWWESYPRVAVETLINGIPVLASNRGGLPETLQEAGHLFDIPENYTPQTRLVPSAEEVAPWIEMILRLWDDEEFYEQERRRCLAAAEAWWPERLLPRFEEFFSRVRDSECQLTS